LAREVAALYDLELAPPPGREPERAGDEPVDVAVEDFAGCPRYVGRLFRGATIAPSPVWLKTRLLDAGMRPISNVVDVTNYVMLALGNPLHAFDHAKLTEGRIVVRRARSRSLGSWAARTARSARRRRPSSSRRRTSSRSASSAPRSACACAPRA